MSFSSKHKSKASITCQLTSFFNSISMQFITWKSQFLFLFLSFLFHKTFNSQVQSRIQTKMHNVISQPLPVELIDTEQCLEQTKEQAKLLYMTSQPTKHLSCIFFLLLLLLFKSFFSRRKFLIYDSCNSSKVIYFSYCLIS